MGSNKNYKTSEQPRYCVGGPTFRPSQSLEDRDRHDAVIRALHERNDLEMAIKTWFSIDEGDGDEYVYHASVSVKLSQVQRIIEKGGAEGLHAWYWAEKDGERQPLPPPPTQDIDSYISIFLPTTATASALKSFASNAKRSSIRSAVASHLVSKRFIDPSHPFHAQLSSIPKTKTKALLPCNPYLDFWAWSCHVLQWCAIYMHHFGCALPTHESLTILKILSQGRTIADVGSGNGYWTMMLRAYGLSVIPIDSAQSEWRVNWLEDSEDHAINGSVGDSGPGAGAGPTGTTIADGAAWLSSQQGSSQDNDGGKDLVLLIVYPVVGPDGAGSFTRSLMAAYAGDTVAVVGTQNHNGYTGFRGMTMDEYMEREHGKSGWERVVQIPLPSFPGKDDALFVFQRKG
ncbi:hypothetical protein V8F20_000055 [Naviculisporaceae sp. PSN 640]